MWKGTGRSGIGDQSINGDYDDWCGLSMNGKQFKNRLTKETRDLSGADYWHQRKAIEPKMLEDIPTYVNGRPNIAAFAEPTQPTPKGKPPAKKKTAYETIALADSHYERLCNLSEALDVQLENGELEFTDYAYARKNLDKRIDKAWLRVCRDRQWNENGDDSLGTQREPPAEPWESGEWYVDNTQTLANAHKPHKPVSFDIIPKESVFFNLADDNTLKILFVKVLTCWLVVSNVVSTTTNTSKEILTEGLI